MFGGKVCVLAMAPPAMSSNSINAGRSHSTFKQSPSFDSLPHSQPRHSMAPHAIPSTSPVVRQNKWEYDMALRGTHLLTAVTVCCALGFTLVG